jgi:hypothetical protein
VSFGVTALLMTNLALKLRNTLVYVLGQNGQSNIDGLVITYV